MEDKFQFISLEDRFHFVKFDHDNDRVYVDKDLFKGALRACLSEIAAEDAKVAQEQKEKADAEEQAICDATSNLNAEELEVWKKKYNDWDTIGFFKPCTTSRKDAYWKRWHELRRQSK